MCETEDYLAMLKSRTFERDGRLLVPFFACREMARECGISPREAELRALANGVCPSRYERSLGTLGLSGQARLLSSRVAVAGCGGLGGWLTEMLARLGVGELVLADGDVFCDNNLNRQLYCEEDNLGMPKAQAAARRVERVNGAVSAFPHVVYLDEENAPGLLAGCDLVLDALDGNRARRAVFSACKKLGIPFVHGAIGGWYAQVSVCRPQDHPLWDRDDTPDKGIEIETGNPTFTPPFAAAVEAAEAVKLLAGLDSVPVGELLWFDLQRHDFQKLRMQ